MYRYRLIEENKVKDVGITDDPERKERELKKQGKKFSHFKIEGAPVTRESAEKWEKEEKVKRLNKKQSMEKSKDSEHLIKIKEFAKKDFDKNADSDDKWMMKLIKKDEEIENLKIDLEIEIADHNSDLKDYVSQRDEAEKKVESLKSELKSANMRADADRELIKELTTENKQPEDKPTNEIIEPWDGTEKWEDGKPKDSEVVCFNCKQFCVDNPLCPNLMMKNLAQINMKPKDSDNYKILYDFKELDDYYSTKYRPTNDTCEHCGELLEGNEHFPTADFTCFIEKPKDSEPDIRTAYNHLTQGFDNAIKKIESLKSEHEKDRNYIAELTNDIITDSSKRHKLEEIIEQAVKYIRKMYDKMDVYSKSVADFTIKKLEGSIKPKDSEFYSEFCSHWQECFHVDEQIRATEVVKDKEIENLKKENTKNLQIQRQNCKKVYQKAFETNKKINTENLELLKGRDVFLNTIKHLKNDKESDICPICESEMIIKVIWHNGKKYWHCNSCNYDGKVQGL